VKGAVGSNDILIIGASAAGVSAAREIRAVDSSVPVRLFSEEPEWPYYRPFLTEAIGDEGVTKRSGFFLSAEEWYEKNGIEVRRGEKVTRIDTAAREIVTAGGERHSYGRCIIATGSRPFVPFPDAGERGNVFAVRTLRDTAAVRECAKRSSSAIIVGGGLLGLEAAYALSAKGLAVTVLEASERILPRQLDEECAEIAGRIIKNNNVELVMGVTADSILGEGNATGLGLSNGDELSADMVIFSIGVRPAVELARDCGIRVDRAIVVNERMETSEPGIYACGDAAEFMGKTIALWMPAVRQGKIAGSNAAGLAARYEEEVYPAVLNLFGSRIFSAGQLCQDIPDGEYRPCMDKDEEKGHFRKTFYIDDRLAGFILIGNVSDSKELLSTLKKGASPASG
jgi:NAD(P)H-nitrite reductase large subunit